MPSLTPGHPDRCSCGECAYRLAALEDVAAIFAAQAEAAAEVDRRLAARGTYLPAPRRDALLGTTLAWLERPGVQS